MTPQEHNRIIGILHLIWGGFSALMLLFLVPFFLLLMPVIGSDPTAPPEIKVIFGLFGLFFLMLAVVFGVPPLLAGYAILKRRRWGRTAGIVAACLAAISFPFGTALCVYTLWFMFGPGENFYKAGRAGWPTGLGAAGASTFDWESRRGASQREHEYRPPPQPPDWRG